jgi:two-component system, sensor histidine kinase and response regulator
MKETTPWLSRYGAAMAVLVIGVALSFGAYYWTIRHEQQRLARYFHLHAHNGAQKLYELSYDQVRAVEELRDLIREAGSQFTRAKFDLLAQAVFARHPHTQVMAWCPQVSALQRASFEQATQTGDARPFTILHQTTDGQTIPAATSLTYAPILFTQSRGADIPLPRGFDLYHNPAWSAILVHAHAAHQTVAIPDFDLHSSNKEPQRQPALTFAVPLFDEASESAKPLMGYLLASSSWTELIAETKVNLAYDELEFAFIKSTPSDRPVTMATEPLATDEIGALGIEKVIGGRQFYLTCTPSPSFKSKHQSRVPVIVLSGGMAFTVLATIGLIALGLRSTVSEQLISRRTTELRKKITEHARSEVALSVALSENAILAAAVANTTAAVSISDPQQRDNPFIFVNRAFSTLTGYNTEEAVGRNPSFLYGERTELKERERITESIHQRKPIRVELLTYRKDGTTWWNDLSITPVFDDRGLLVYWVGIHNDVTETKMASLALRRERDRLRRQLEFANAIAAAAETVVAHDDTRRILDGIVMQVGQALHVDRALIFEVDLTRRVCVGLCEWLNPEAVGVTSVLDIYPTNLFHGSVDMMMAHKTWIESHDDAINPVILSDGSAPILHGRMSIRSLLFFPFQIKPQSFYLLALSQVRFRRTWKHDEIGFLEAVSKLTTVALEKTRLIAQRHMTEIAVRASEMRYRAIVEDQSELICRFRSDSTMSFVNEAYCRYFGKQRNELENHSFLPLLPAEDRDLVQRQFIALSPDNNVAVYSHRIILNKAVRWVQWTTRAFFDELSQPIEFQSVGQDITERKHAEDQLRASEASFRSLLEQAPEGILIADSEGRFVEANPVACAMVGYHRSELLRMTVADLLAKEELSALAERMRLYAEGHTVFGERSLKRKNGAVVQVEMIAKKLPDNRLLTIVRDLSERLKNERSLREAKDAAEQASLAKSAFLANMSHEIRTPMNGILGMLGLLLDSPLDDEAREFAETARLSGEHLLTIINDILDFSKIEADRLELEAIVFELPVLIEDTVALFAEQAQGKGLELVCFVHKDVPMAVRGDPARLRQVLINLLGNAVKFTHTGEVVVRVGLAGHQTDSVSETGTALTTPLSSDEKSVRLHITVSDTGPGISSEAQPRIFQAFSQADSSTTRRYGGTGLGLAISRHLVELMGGRIDFHTTPQGTTFIFSVALEMPAAPAEPVVVPAHLRDLRIVIIDDNATCRDVLTARLLAWGMKAEAVADPAQALQILQDGIMQTPPVALALVDLDMPEMDGLALLRVIKQRPELTQIPVVALSTIGNRTQSQEAKRLGAVACVTKPVRSVQLLDTLLFVMGVGRDPQATRHLAADIREDLRILLADDNLVNRRLVLAQLKQMGLSADSASNGREVLQVLERAVYDIILLDGQMPDLDGYATAQEIRQREGTQRHTIIIALTANVLSGDRERCLAAGMDNYLAKPIKIQVLHDIIRQYFPAPTDNRSDAASPRTETATTTTRSSSVRDITARMRRAIHTCSGLDTAVIEDLIAQGGLELIHTLSEALHGEMLKQLPRLEQALQQQDLPTASAAVHGIKGAAWSLGLRELASACLALEHAIEVGMADTARLFVELKRAYDNAKAGLAELDEH